MKTLQKTGAIALLLAAAAAAQFSYFSGRVRAGISRLRRPELVKEGIPCLVAGLCVAIPAGLAVALILRRGFVLGCSAAGVAAGALSGLAGLGMLELHCANLKAIHVIVWHVAVVVASGAIRFGAGRVAAARGAAPGPEVNP